MKKIGSLLTAAALIAGLAACGSPDAQSMPLSVADLGEEIGGEITVSCFDGMLSETLLEAAKRKFEEMHPGTTVNIKTHSAMPEIKESQGEDGTSVMVMTNSDEGSDEYINKVSTELMSGGGADILAMDILPYQRYADSGQLVNLDTLVKEDASFQLEDYRSNVLNAVRYNDGLYFLPLDYSFNYYAYDKTLVNEAAAAKLKEGSPLVLEELFDIAAQSFTDGGGENQLLGFAPYENARMLLLNMLLREKREQFYNVAEKRANFHDGAFAQLLEQVNGYAEQGYIPNTTSADADNADSDQMMELMMQEPTDRYFYKQNSTINLLSYYSTDDDLHFMTGGMSGIEKDDEIAGLAANAQGQVGLEFSQAYAINQNSQNKRTAWEFLKLLLSEEMQMSPELMPFNLPLHNSAREQKSEMLVSGAIFGGEMADELTPAQQDTLAKYRAKIEEFSAQLNTYEANDAIIEGMVEEEAIAYFDGLKSAEEVAKAIQSKAELYLSE